MNRPDTPLAFFGACAALTLAVSLPATFALLRPFHDTGDTLGTALAVFATAVFEIGAVGSKLITLAVPHWGKRLTALTIALLLLTTIGNWLAGVELFRVATLPSTLAEWRASGAGPLLAVVAAALFPVLLFVWLTAFTARWKDVQAQRAHGAQAEQKEVAPTASQPQPIVDDVAPVLALVAEPSIVELRDVHKLTWPEIGKRKGYSRTRAQQLYNEAKKVAA